MRRLRFIHRGADGPEELLLELDGSRCRFIDGSGRTRIAEASRLPDGRLSLLFDDGRQVCGRVRLALDGGGAGALRGGEVEVVTGSSRRKISLADPLRDRVAHAREDRTGEAAEEEIRALMPGRVVEIQASEGQRVEAGALILVLEAMKMQNEIRCTSAGTVRRIGVQPGAAVDGGVLLAVVRSDES
ncbi:MAG TPA: biotin/lipoyl-containing protein [Thermoanaerobaculia bacterium]